jgi:hypothetical protein
MLLLTISVADSLSSTCLLAFVVVQSFQAGVARVLPVQYRGNDGQFAPAVQAAEDALHAAQSARVGEADDEEAGTARKRRRRRQSTTTAKAATEDLVPGAEPLAPPAARLDRYYASTPRFSSTAATGAAGVGASSAAAAATFSAPLSSPEIDLALATGRHIVAPSVALDSSAPLQHAKSAAEVAAEQEQAAAIAAAAAAAAEASNPKGRKRGRPAAATPPDVVAQQAGAVAAVAAAPAATDDDGLILPNPAAPDADFFRLHWQRLRAPRSIVAMFPFVDPTASQVVRFGAFPDDGTAAVPPAAIAATAAPAAATTTTKVVEARPAKVRKGAAAVATPSPAADVTAAAATPAIDALTPRKPGRPSKAALPQQSQDQAVVYAPSAAAAPVARAKPRLEARIKPAAKRAKVASAASSVAPAAAPAAPAAASVRPFTSDEIERAEETIALSSRSSLRSLAALVGQPVAEDEAAFAAQRTNRAWFEQMKHKLLLYQRGGK